MLFSFSFISNSRWHRTRFDRTPPFSLMISHRWMLGENFDRTPYANCPTFSRSRPSRLSRFTQSASACCYFFFILAKSTRYESVPRDWWSRKRRRKGERELFLPPAGCSQSTLLFFQCDFTSGPFLAILFAREHRTATWKLTERNKAFSWDRSLLGFEESPLQIVLILRTYRRNRKADNDEEIKWRSHQRRKLTCSLFTLLYPKRSHPSEILFFCTETVNMSRYSRCKCVV